ncbi:MAG: Rieske 2Fe-2S domain-containing protein [Deltaproteobacteria bacterium]|nr:Rieske 2Fe-2S domain-containing protein [Deltaproteobacteria bacterium]
MTDDARTVPAPDATPMARRTLLDLAVGATASGVGLLALLPAVRFATPPAQPTPGASGSVVGRREEFGENTARVVNLDGEPVLVLALPGGDFRAFMARCTHLGCVVSYNPAREQIECPCHGGRFGCDGRVLAGPPPSALRELPVVVRRDEVMVVRG